jgi:hypothetical protein
VDAGFPPASRAQLLEKITSMTPMSIHRNIGIENVDPSKHRDRKCRSIETSGSKMSIHRNIGIENVDPSKHRDRNGLVQSKVIVI